MYEYLYVPMEIGDKLSFENRDAAHRVVISQQAMDGWRYVGYIPTTCSVYGRPTGIDLIFERELEETPHAL